METPAFAAPNSPQPLLGPAASRLKTRELVSEILRGGSEELDLKLCQRELVMRGMKNPADMRRILSALRSANEGVDRVAEVVLGICADIATSSEGSRGSRKRRVGRIMRVLGPYLSMSKCRALREEYANDLVTLFLKERLPRSPLPAAGMRGNRPRGRVLR